MASSPPPTTTHTRRSRSRNRPANVAGPSGDQGHGDVGDTEVGPRPELRRAGPVLQTCLGSTGEPPEPGDCERSRRPPPAATIAANDRAGRPGCAARHAATASVTRQQHERGTAVGEEQQGPEQHAADAPPSAGALQPLARDAESHEATPTRRPLRTPRRPMSPSTTGTAPRPATGRRGAPTRHRRAAHTVTSTPPGTAIVAATDSSATGHAPPSPMPSSAFSTSTKPGG